MADRIEANLPKQNDAAYIRALDSNGNPILISKADLAQVAAELIGTASVTKDGLMSASIMKNIAGSYFIDTGKLYSVDGDSCAIFNAYGWSANTIIMFVFGTSPSYKAIVGPLNSYHFSVYKDDEKFYIKSNQNTSFTLQCIAAASNVTVKESDVDVSTLTKVQ